MVRKTKKKKVIKRMAPIKKEQKNTNIFESKAIKRSGIVVSGLAVFAIVFTYIYYSSITGMLYIENLVSLLALAFPMYVMYYSLIRPADNKNTQILYWMSITVMLIIIMLFINAIFSGNFCYWFTNTCCL